MDHKRDPQKKRENPLAQVATRHDATFCAQRRTRHAVLPHRYLEKSLGSKRSQAKVAEIKLTLQGSKPCGDRASSSPLRIFTVDPHRRTLQRIMRPPGNPSQPREGTVHRRKSFRFLAPFDRVNQNLGCLRPSIRDRHV